MTRPSGSVAGRARRRSLAAPERDTALRAPRPGRGERRRGARQRLFAGHRSRLTRGIAGEPFARNSRREHHGERDTTAELSTRHEARSYLRPSDPSPWRDRAERDSRNDAWGSPNGPAAEGRRSALAGPSRRGRCRRRKGQEFSRRPVAGDRRRLEAFPRARLHRSARTRRARPRHGWHSSAAGCMRLAASACFGVDVVDAHH